MTSKTIVAILAAIMLAGAGCAGDTGRTAARKPNTVTAATQPAGTQSLKVDLVRLDRPGFIVIREDDAKLGAVLGVSPYLTAGEHVAVEIILSRVTLEGEVLFAVAYMDSGDALFSAENDPAFPGRRGDILYAEVEMGPLEENAEQYYSEE